MSAAEVGTIRDATASTIAIRETFCFDMLAPAKKPQTLPEPARYDHDKNLVKSERACVAVLELRLWAAVDIAITLRLQQQFFRPSADVRGSHYAGAGMPRWCDRAGAQARCPSRDQSAPGLGS